MTEEETQHSPCATTSMFAQAHTHYTHHHHHYTKQKPADPKNTRVQRHMSAVGQGEGKSEMREGNGGGDMISMHYVAGEKTCQKQKKRK